MKHFKEFTVQNYRGFDYIKVENLGQINLFLGKNSAGKSSLLEAIFLLSGLGDVRHLSNITTLRTQHTNQLNEIRSLFHNFNYEKEPRLQAIIDTKSDAETDAEEREVILQPYYGNRDLYAESPDDLIGVNSTNANMVTTKMNILPFGIASTATLRAHGEIILKKRSETHYHGHSINFRFPTTQQEGVLSPSAAEISDTTATISEANNQLEALFLSSGKEEGTLHSSYDQVVRNGDKEELIALLQSFDRTILGIENLQEGLHLKLTGLKQLLPLSMAGDGLKRFLKIAVAILSSESRILLIDEIDNGLHYAAYPLLWKSLFAICQKRLMQLFITTHSLEVLTALEQVLSQETTAMQESLRLYTIEKTKLKGFQAYGYGYEGVKGAIEREIELRS